MALPYQKREDAIREQQAEWRRRWFGPSRTDAWKAVAGELGARFEDRSWLNGAKVHHQVGPWMLTLDTYVVMAGKTPIPYTRITSPFVTSDNFRFALTRENFLTPVARWLGAQDVTTGFDEFDDAFVVKTNDERKVKSLFADDAYRALLLQNPQVMLKVADHEGFFGREFPPDADVLTAVVHGHIKEMDDLHAMFQLVAETLERLHAVGTATDATPRVR